jgi:hypothetical protein
MINRNEILDKMAQEKGKVVKDPKLAEPVKHEPSVPTTAIPA